jgi:hypothetical protein
MAICGNVPAGKYDTALNPRSLWSRLIRRTSVHALERFDWSAKEEAISISVRYQVEMFELVVHADQRSLDVVPVHFGDHARHEHRLVLAHVREVPEQILRGHKKRFHGSRGHATAA